MSALCCISWDHSVTTLPVGEQTASKMNEFSLGREEESSTSARPTLFLHIIILGMGN